MTDERVGFTDLPVNIPNKVGDHVAHTKFEVCPNPECKHYCLTVQLHHAQRDRQGQFSSKGQAIRAWQLIPEAGVKTFAARVPSPILDDYREACLILQLSPKASATLARRCLQGIIRDYWQAKVKPGRLVDEIEALKNDLDPLTWSAIDAVRKVGNIGAHMEKDINLIIDVEPEEAGLLIGLIESLIKDWYVAREERQKHLNAITSMAQAKTAQKSQQP